MEVKEEYVPAFEEGPGREVQIVSEDFSRFLFPVFFRRTGEMEIREPYHDGDSINVKRPFDTISPKEGNNRGLGADCGRRNDHSHSSATEPYIKNN